MWMDWTQLILTGLIDYGAWVLGAATLVSAAGLPLPATLLLLAAGAFARQGLLDGPSAILLATVGAIVGDVISYGLGRTGHALAATRIQSLPAWQQAHDLFQRWGALAIFLSRFALTPLALPVNVLAGSTRYAPGRFLTPVLLGEALWVVLFGGLGYAFADQWQAVSAAAGEASAWLMGLSAAAALAVWAGARLKGITLASPSFSA
ncbi:MAG: VTT domain-containing protein [Anaerolineales bacterium]|nr:VTT domain-containing protein [Anaerolineales bacterium]